MKNKINLVHDQLTPVKIENIKQINLLRAKISKLVKKNHFGIRPEKLQIKDCEIKVTEQTGKILETKIFSKRSFSTTNGNKSS